MQNEGGLPSIWHSSKWTSHQYIRQSHWSTIWPTLETRNWDAWETVVTSGTSGAEDVRECEQVFWPVSRESTVASLLLHHNGDPRTDLWSWSLEEYRFSENQLFWVDDTNQAGFPWADCLNTRMHRLANHPCVQKTSSENLEEKKGHRFRNLNRSTWTDSTESDCGVIYYHVSTEVIALRLALKYGRGIEEKRRWQNVTIPHSYQNKFDIILDSMQMCRLQKCAMLERDLWPHNDLQALQLLLLNSEILW